MAGSSKAGLPPLGVSGESIELEEIRLARGGGVLEEEADRGLDIGIAEANWPDMEGGGVLESDCWRCLDNFPSESSRPK